MTENNGLGCIVNAFERGIDDGFLSVAREYKTRLSINQMMSG
jgi:hypothetical protein